MVYWVCLDLASPTRVSIVAAFTCSLSAGPTLSLLVNSVLHLQQQLPQRLIGVTCLQTDGSVHMRKSDAVAWF